MQLDQRQPGGVITVLGELVGAVLDDSVEHHQGNPEEGDGGDGAQRRDYEQQSSDEQDERGFGQRRGHPEESGRKIEVIEIVAVRDAAAELRRVELERRPQISGEQVRRGCGRAGGDHAHSEPPHECTDHDLGEQKSDDNAEHDQRLGLVRIAGDEVVGDLSRDPSFVQVVTGQQLDQPESPRRALPPPARQPRARNMATSPSRWSVRSSPPPWRTPTAAVCRQGTWLTMPPGRVTRLIGWPVRWTS